MHILQTMMAILLTSHAAMAMWCDVYVRDAERRYQIPEHLLTAVSWSESGQYISKMGLVAWPWTINVNGKGYIYETKEQAIQAVVNFQRQGQKSIDVGCMQVNLKHHPKAFKNLQEAFDPRTNVEYAARFINALKNQHNSWNTAVGNYHSATPSLHEIYRKKVLKNWQKAKLQLTNQTLTPSQENLLLVKDELGDNFSNVQSGIVQTNMQSVRPMPPMSQRFNAIRNYPVIVQQQGQKQIVNNPNKGRFIPLNRAQGVGVNRPIPINTSQQSMPHAPTNDASVVQISEKRFYPLTGAVVGTGGRRFIPLR